MINENEVCVDFAFVLSSGVAFAQSDTVAAGKKAEPVSYVPKLDGTIKAKMEVDLNGGEYRFSVRNARLGVRGNVSPKMNYRLQMDFGNEGKISLLDAYAGYQSGGFTAELGQQQYHFSTDMDRGPSTNLFANRSFLSKYLTSYYGSELSGGKPSTTSGRSVRAIWARFSHTVSHRNCR